MALGTSILSIVHPGYGPKMAIFILPRNCPFVSNHLVAGRKVNSKQLDRKNHSVLVAGTMSI